MEIEQLYQLFLAHPSVQTDTRKLREGDLFFALRGPNFNGNLYAEEALKAGAAYAIVDDPMAGQSGDMIFVDEVLETLQQLARHHRRQFDIPVIAITGSNGKTTSKELVTAVLRKKFVTYATVGNLNNHIGVPLTLLSLRSDAEMAIVEMGANHLHEIEAYCRIAEPTHGLITNCGKAHIEGFGGIEGVRKGKGELYDYLRANEGTVFRNADLHYLDEMAQGIARQVTYGSSAAEFEGRAVTEGIFLGVDLRRDREPLHLSTRLVGAYNFPNVMSAVAIGRSFGLEWEDIASALEGYQPDNSRSQWLRRGGNEIILDAYNANPTSMKAAIESFAASALPAKRLWLGAMKEMGPAERAEHEALVRLAESYHWEQLILVGEEFAPVKGAHLWFRDSAGAADYIRHRPPVDASILIKGSRGSRMEAMLEALA